jgi:NAD(P)-dependent dehydrogenase (short-subunit alcohol dehydrogenase family)
MPAKKVALVTGTSTGIGLSAVIALANAGYQVVATMRNLIKSDKLRQQAIAGNFEIDIQSMDVQDDASVTNAVDYVLLTYGRIDLLVNNAGAGFVGTTEQTSIADLRRVMDVNLYGVWRVTSAILPHMRAAKSGRIITLSSIGGMLGQPFNDAYCAAKFAVEGMMESLAPVVRGFGIDVILVEPGPVHTQFVENAGGLLKQDPATPEDAYSAPIHAYMQAIQGRFGSVGQTAEEVAEVIVTAAQAVEPHFRYQTSPFVQGRVATKYTDPTGDTLVIQTSQSLWPSASSLG